MADGEMTATARRGDCDGYSGGGGDGGGGGGRTMKLYRKATTFSLIDNETPTARVGCLL